MHPTPHTKPSTLPPIPTWKCTTARLASTPFFSKWGWEAVTVSVDMASYQTIRLPSDSLSRWRWDRASEARTPADTERMEASPDLLPDGGALMWAQVSLVSPAWLGLRWCQDAGTFRAHRPGFWWAVAAPLRGLAPGQGVVMGHKLTRVPTLILLWIIDAMYGYIHIHTGTHRQTLTHMKSAHSRALRIALRCQSCCAQSERGKETESCDKTKKQKKLKGVNEWKLVRGRRGRSREAAWGEEGRGGAKNLGAERIPCTFYCCCANLYFGPAWTLCTFMNIVSFSPWGF